MASNDDPSELPPKSPRLRRTDDEDAEPLMPDTEDNVVEQSESVLRNFMFQTYQRESPEQAAEAPTPSLPEITNFTQDPLSPTAQVGRQLALIGDDINKKYEHQFRHMVQQLCITQDTAYEAFAGVARKLFRDGINWGRIVTLLCFGYRIAIDTFQRGIGNFFQSILKFITRFIAQEKIAKWIAEQGGWIAALRYIPESIGWPWVALFVGIAIVSIGATVYLSKR